MRYKIEENKIEKIINKINSKNIDIKNTIEDAVFIDFIDREFWYMSVDVASDNNLCYKSALKEMGENIEFLSDEYFEKLQQFIDGGKRIWLSIVYADPEYAGCAEDDEIYHAYEKDDGKNIGLTYCNGEKEIVISPDSWTGGLTTNIGILITKEKVYFGVEYGGSCGCPPEVEIVENSDEPVLQLACEIVNEVITFED